MPSPTEENVQILLELPVYRMFQLVAQREIWMRAHFNSGVDIVLRDSGDFVAAILCPVPGDPNEEFFNTTFFEMWRPESEIDKAVHFTADYHYIGPPLTGAPLVDFFEGMLRRLDMTLRLNATNERVLQARLAEDERRRGDIDWIVDFRATFASKVQRWRLSERWGQLDLHDPNEPPLSNCLHGDPTVGYQLQVRENWAGHETATRILERGHTQKLQRVMFGEASAAYETPLLESEIQQRAWIDKYDREHPRIYSLDDAI